MKTEFGRCNSPGHGSRCSYSQEIQSKPLSKTKQRREGEAEIRSQLNEARTSQERPE